MQSATQCVTEAWPFLKKHVLSLRMWECNIPIFFKRVFCLVLPNGIGAKLSHLFAAASSLWPDASYRGPLLALLKTIAKKYHFGIIFNGMYNIQPT